MKAKFLVSIVFDDEDGGTLPKDRQVAAMLSNSTASEALADATCCSVSMELHYENDINDYRAALAAAKIDPETVRGCEQTESGWIICLLPHCVWYRLTPDGEYKVM